MGLAGHSEFAKAYYGAFPDLKHTIDNGLDLLIKEKAVLRFTLTGAHQGKLMATAHTGKQITISGMAMFYFAGAGEGAALNLRPDGDDAANRRRSVLLMKFDDQMATPRGYPDERPTLRPRSGQATNDQTMVRAPFVLRPWSFVYHYGRQTIR
jgi:hypothetical protein